METFSWLCNLEKVNKQHLFINQPNVNNNTKFINYSFCLFGVNSARDPELFVILLKFSFSFSSCPGWRGAAHSGGDG